MRILFLTFYYRPDLCAGSFRATPLVAALVERLPPGSHVDVITTQPNRYRSFSADSPEREVTPGVSVVRVALPAHHSGMLDQSRAFLFFARAALRETADRDYDAVVATSSRLMTAVLAAWIARRKRARLYLDIRDIFVDTIRDVLPRKLSCVLVPLFGALERFAVNTADKVNLVSRGFAGYFESRYPRQRFSFFTNGVDDEFVDAAARVQSTRVDDTAPVSVLYAGNVGEGQGLHAIVPALAARMRSRVRFKIIGDGGRRRALEAALHDCGVDTVELAPPLNRDELLRAYTDADVLFVHLNDCAAFEKVLPSKLFEYAALGKPVWAGVSGYPAEFIASEITNAAVFRPCDVEAAVAAFDKLTLRDAPRPEFVARYARSAINRDLAADIVAVARGE